MTQVSQITLIELLDIIPGGPNSSAGEMVNRAYQFALQAHDGKHRESGELYIEHDLAVAQIMAQLGVDLSTIVASLLHDSFHPHSDKQETDLTKIFNAEVNNLVSGLHNLYAYAEKASHQYQGTNGNAQALETIRRAILSIIEGDIRIILIRMADCLQDLRKAGNLLPDRQREIANEAMHIYAPLANRLGVWQLKWELEDLSFRYLEPDQFKEIATKLAERRAERTERIENAIVRLRQKIQAMGLKAELTGRPKHIYSIYRKMERKKVGLDHIYDIQALRIILFPTDAAAYKRMSLREKDELDRNLCYQVLGAVHSLWQPVPREFDDYIATPKPNGYKSLHTAVIDSETGHTLEVQIRTLRMHEEAERGIAAHWAYKEGGARVSASAQRRIQNLRELLTSLRETDATHDNDFFETEVVADRIYAFTPKGDVVELPAGSTPIDFAYQIHTQVGHRCRGARVNGKMISLDYKLKSGDRVEILTAKRGGPSRDWMNPSLGYSGSARTRSKIRQWFRTQEREQNIQQGREVVDRELKRLGLTETYTISDIAQALKFDDEEKFLAKVGFGDIQSTQISGAIAILKRNLEPDDELRPLLQTAPPKAKGLTVRGLSGLHTKMAGCCNPIPPEPIIGYITRGHGVTIHRENCKQVQAINERERLIEVDWGTEAETYPIPIVVKAYRRPGLVDEMNAILRGQQIAAPKTKTVTANSIITVYLVVEVTSLDQLNWLLNKLEGVSNVFEVQRQRWN